MDTSSDDYAPGTTTHHDTALHDTTTHDTTTHDPDTLLDADDPRRTDGTDGSHRA